MSKKNKVFHVGQLNLSNIAKRPKTSYSLEGSGLSVSLCPNEWRTIAKLPGELFSLSKKDPNFYVNKQKDKKKILKWCVDNNFLTPQKKYRISFYDEELEEYFQEFDTYKKASEEAFNPEDIEEVDGYVFDQKGIEYWESFCSSKINNALAESYAPIFYAEAMGFDGVWWNEILDTSIFSAPRGVIFQSKLKEWNISLLAE